MQPYRVHPKSKWWTAAVQLAEVTSCRRGRLSCQFYEHNNYLTSDAVKDWFVKFVTGWTFSSDSSVWRGRCLGSDQCDLDSVKPVLNWANVCSPEHSSDTSTNYDSFLNWTFSSPNMVRTVQTLLHSQLACNEMQASARTCGRRAADSMIENVG